MKNVQDYLGRDIWREILVISIRRTGNFQEGLDRLNARVFDEPLDRLLRVLQRRGQIAPGTDIPGAVALFSDLVMAVSTRNSPTTTLGPGSKTASPAMSGPRWWGLAP